MNKQVIVIGGGTFNHVTSHLALAAPAFGGTAEQLYRSALNRFKTMDVELALTRMADYGSNIVTNEDLDAFVESLIASNRTKVVFFNAAVCDFEGSVDGYQGKYATRLSSRTGEQTMKLTPYTNKIVGKIRKHRKDIFVVAFKTTCNASEAEMFKRGLSMLKENQVNLVLVNDVATRKNMIVTPEEGVYHGERDELLEKLVEMAYYRSHLSFTRTTVIEGQPVGWEDARVPANLRSVVDWLVEQSAYKTFNGATTGHFAAKLGEGHFLTSIRKTNFNDIAKNGMVEVTTVGDDEVIARGVRPSVGGQSQRIIFSTYPELDCIVHFHCPLREDHKDAIPVMSQLEYECGSHECGENTKNGLKQFGNLYAVMLDMHGPNIVFSKSTDPEEVKQFILDNFDLTKPTNGFTEAYITDFPDEHTDK